MLDTWSDMPDAIPPEIRAEYVATFSAPDTIHAVCEEYRAAATEHDLARAATAWMDAQRPRRLRRLRSWWHARRTGS